MDGENAWEDGSQSGTEYGYWVVNRGRTETGLTFPFSECGHGKMVRGSAWLWQNEQGVS